MTTTTIAATAAATRRAALSWRRALAARIGGAHIGRTRRMARSERRSTLLRGGAAGWRCGRCRAEVLRLRGIGAEKSVFWIPQRQSADAGKGGVRVPNRAFANSNKSNPRDCKHLSEQPGAVGLLCSLVAWCWCARRHPAKVRVLCRWCVVGRGLAARPGVSGRDGGPVVWLVATL
eukprot:2490591-Prymnesium_polylepis.1